jgi:enoyl-CoA hydratase
MERILALYLKRQRTLVHPPRRSEKTALDAAMEEARCWAVVVGSAMLYEGESVRVTADRGIATLWLDFPGTTANLLNLDRLLQIDRALDSVLEHVTIHTLVIRSAKPSGFCGGFDTDALAFIATDGDAREYAAAGQRVLARIANAECVTVAVLEGPCLGPGLELALACDRRFAIATAASRFAFGDLPTGWGGVTYLTRIVGARAAVEMIAGREVQCARQALGAGLVDRAVCARRAKIELRAYLDNPPTKPRPWRTPFDAWAARRIVAAYYLDAHATTIPAAAMGAD